jgi:hypothetical protein
VKNVVEVTSGVIMCMLSFMKINLGIKKLYYLYYDRQHDTFDVQVIYILHNMVILMFRP